MLSFACAYIFYTNGECPIYFKHSFYFTFLVHRRRITFICRFLYSFQNKREKKNNSEAWNRFVKILSSQHLLKFNLQARSNIAKATPLTSTAVFGLVVSRFVFERVYDQLGQINNLVVCMILVPVSIHWTDVRRQGTSFWSREKFSSDNS